MKRTFLIITLMIINIAIQAGENTPYIHCFQFNSTEKPETILFQQFNITGTPNVIHAQLVSGQYREILKASYFRCSLGNKPEYSVLITNDTTSKILSGSKETDVPALIFNDLKTRYQTIQAEKRLQK